MAYMRSVTVFAPATVANVGSAFDVLGFAVAAPGDTVTVRRATTPGVTISDITGDNGILTTDSSKNTAGVSVLALLKHLESKDRRAFGDIGVEISLTKGLPIGSGLGSSSASTVAAVVAANELCGAPLSREELLRFAMEGERVACGAAHADNVAPALLGGFVLIRSYDPLDIVHLPTPSNAWVTVLSPSLELKTQDARKVLKRSVSLESAISQWGNVAALVAGIYQNDIALMGRALEDKIVEPERAQLIPGYAAAKRAALEAGASGCSISGSGPSLFALAQSEDIAHRVGAAMRKAFAALDISSIPYVSQINSSGAVVTHKE
ncbi:MAG: homoserine kinase [Pseudomonadota bacterium]|jgi:homoserine kinase